MPFRSLRRHWTPFGEVFERVKGPEKGQSLLVTKNGKKLLLDYRKLLKSVKVEAVGNTDNVSFSCGIHPRFIGEGAHAKVFILTGSEEKPLQQRFKRDIAHRPSVVLKVYRASVPEQLRPDGFTQFVGEMAIYNYLKKIHAAPFAIRPLSYYFVSGRLTVRKFINAPTFEEIKESLVPKQIRRRPLSLAMNDTQIDEFVSRFRITKEELGGVFGQLQHALLAGQRINFSANPEIPVALDLGVKNFFILGRDSQGKLIFSIIDQGRRHVEGVGEKIMQHSAFMP